MTLAELYRELEAHDWHYQMSDDHSVYSAGHDSNRRLLAEAGKIEGGDDLFIAYSTHIYSGEPWGTPKAPKPAKPEVHCCAPEQELPGQDDERREP